MELDPYHTTAFWPLPVLVVYGQNAKLEPTIWEGGFREDRDVVGSAWMDEIFLYCADKRHSPDTKFFIIEQDFRFYPEDCDGDALEARSHGAPMPQANRENAKVNYDSVSPELRDLLAYCTAARRWRTDKCPEGHGDLMWMSWEPGLQPSKKGEMHGPYKVTGDKRKSHPGTGNYLWMVTQKGANKIMTEHVPRIRIYYIYHVRRC